MQCGIGDQGLHLAGVPCSDTCLPSLPSPAWSLSGWVKRQCYQGHRELGFKATGPYSGIPPQGVPALGGVALAAVPLQSTHDRGTSYG
jgi:hypothetical protein